MNLGPYAAYIWASYIIVLGALAILALRLIAQGHSYRRAIADLEARGVRRRSARSDHETKP